MDESLKARRAQFFVDGDLQGTLVRRAIIYWLAALAVMSAAFITTKLLWGAAPDGKLFSEALSVLLPAALISLLPLPLILRDLIRVTHRFAGPMLRVRRGLSELAAEGKSPPITPREGDAWADCIADFNTLANRLSRGPGLQSSKLADGS